MKKTEVDRMRDVLLDGLPRSALEISRLTGIKKEQCNSRLSTSKQTFVKVSPGVYRLQEKYLPPEVRLSLNQMTLPLEPVMTAATESAMEAALGDGTKAQQRVEAERRLDDEIRYRRKQVEVLTLRKQVKKLAAEE